MKMIRVTFFTALTAISGLVFGQVPGVTPKTIVLGQSAAFTGPAAQLGIQMNAGTKAYFDHVNAQGGVFGRKIEIKTRDDRYEATLCVENTKKFIEEDKVFALVSYVGTPTTVAAMPVSPGPRFPWLDPSRGRKRCARR
jgi:ABC-type branched-subunit amino acid transport system substrate-binding protein